MNFYVFRNNCQSSVVPIEVIIDHIFYFYSLTWVD